MTFKTKNATIVFAFVAMLMVAPLTISNANADENTTIVDETCGFEISPAASFGAIDRGAASVTQQTVVFTPTGGSTGTGQINVIATDWIGDGARSVGSIVIEGVLDTETVTINSVVYTAADAGEAADQFSSLATAGSDIEVAASLARVINAGSDTANVRAYTSGTNTVTVEAETRGAAGNFAITDTVVDVGTVPTSMTGGGASPVSHIPSETTKFNMVANDGDSTSQNYATKSKFMPGDGVTPAQEMLGGIDTTQNVNLSMEFSTAFLTAATGTINFADTATADDSVIVQGIIYVATASTTSGTNWAIGASATDSAANLATAIDTNPNLSASAVAGEVTITYDTLGLVGNIVETAEVVDAGGDITVDQTELSGGTEYMENLPYDGALTQTLTFSLLCSGT